MKTTLIFEGHEDKQELIWAQKGWAAHQVLREVADILRNKRKYENLETISIQELEKQISFLTQEYEINLYD